MPSPPRVPRFQDPTNLPRFRELLARAGYSEEGVARALGTSTFDEFRAMPTPTVIARTNAGRAIDHLIRVYLLHEVAPVAPMSAAISPLSVATLADAGLLRIEGDWARAAVNLFPYRALVVAYDLAPTTSDYVMGVANTTRGLASQLIPERSTLTLDIGTGSGVIAMLASRFSDRVLATDLNPVALDFARFNAELNNITNIEFRPGSLFEPVKGLTFDRVLCNPPFVITPKSRHLYSDSGMQGDAIMESLIHGAAGVLHPGGIAQCIGNWASLSFSSAQHRLREWLLGSGCDALWMPTATRSPFEYAAAWIGEATSDPQERWRTLQDWLAAYADLGIESITLGTLAMRKGQRHEHGAGPGSLSVLPTPETLAGETGRHVAAMLRAGAQLSRPEYRDLAHVPLAPSPDLRIEQRLAPPDWSPEYASLAVCDGLDLPTPVDSGAMSVIRSLDGIRPLAQVLPPGDQAERISQLCRVLVQRGMLVAP